MFMLCLAVFLTQLYCHSQTENGILLPTLQSALPFLDLHGTPRLEFHQSVFDELREKLMERVATIAEGKDGDRWKVWFQTIFFIFYAANHNQQMQIILTHPLNSHRYVKLEELLEKSFPLVKMPSIQPIVMQVLKHLPKVWMCSVQWIITIVVGCQIYFKIAQYTDRLILKLILQISALGVQSIFVIL